MRHRTRVLWSLALVVSFCVGMLATVLLWGLRLTVTPQPDEPPRVDALLVLYSQPQVYDAAIDLAERGVTDRIFVSAHDEPDGYEKLCGAEAKSNPALQGLSIECFSPEPVTTQGEVMYASERMRELGLHDLGVLTFPQHLERGRILAERCWDGQGRSVSMYMFEPGYSSLRRMEQTIYGALSFTKVAATSGCTDRAEWLEWPTEAGKHLRFWFESLWQGVRS